ncbi:MAG: hypothetical protein KDK04_23975 [Candidatus Competibacteraceae bacterium]|nr:hypothetical protein [Candidatus Competibacteraceae bacterium]
MIRNSATIRRFRRLPSCSQKHCKWKSVRSSRRCNRQTIKGRMPP